MPDLTFVRSRVLLAALALTAALVIAAACGDDGDGETTSAGETPAAGETRAGGETPAAGETPTGGAATAEIKMIPSFQFDRAELAIAADTEVTVSVDNTDDGIPHSFAVYASEADAGAGAEPVAETEVCPGPCTDTVTLNLGAGEYFFRCEVHPSTMTGTVTAE